MRKVNKEVQNTDSVLSIEVVASEWNKHPLNKILYFTGFSRRTFMGSLPESVQAVRPNFLVEAVRRLDFLQARVFRATFLEPPVDFLGMFGQPSFLDLPLVPMAGVIFLRT